MENRSESKKSETSAKPLRITQVHVAFIVDRYLCNNSFALTRSTFRAEASSLFPDSPIPEEVKSLPSLLSIFNEYTSLKEQKVLLDKNGSIAGYIPRRVIPAQIAFVVDCFLLDENYPKTRSVFRTEASSLIAQIPFPVEAKSMARLVLLLNDYMCLKKVMKGKRWMDNIVAIFVCDPASSTSNPVGAPTTTRKGSKVVVYGPHAAAKGSCSEVPISEVSNKDKETEASDHSLKNQESDHCCMNEQAELPGSSLDQEN